MATLKRRGRAGKGQRRPAAKLEEDSHEFIQMATRQELRALKEAWGRKLNIRNEGLTSMRLTFEDVLKRVQVQENECWLYPRRPQTSGHVQIACEGKVGQGHRVIYERLKGPVPPGLELDHLCRNRPCVNPDHVEPVTHQENIRRGYAAKPKKEKPPHYPAPPRSPLTHCCRGHALQGSNLRIHGRQKARICGICASLRSARYRREGRVGSRRKLTPQQCEEILSGYPNQGTLRFWAEKFGVNHETVRRVARGLKR
jgi:HNH endonuclease